ncbi:MAG: hypothetical protein LBE44_02095 [Microbacterium hominis]|nr:hypothetical protein [Microbacterium hominis]
MHASWRAYFEGLKGGLPSQQAYQAPPGLVPSLGDSIEGAAPVAIGAGGEIEDHMKVQLLVRAFQVRGHQIANLDPLGLNAHDLDTSTPSELTIAHYGWSEKDLDKEFELGPGILPRFKSSGTNKMTLRQIVDTCKKIYSPLLLLLVCPREPAKLTIGPACRWTHWCPVHPHPEP